MSRFFRLLVACILASHAFAEEGTTSLHFPNTDVLDVLEFYGRHVKKPIYVAPHVSGGVTIEWFGLRRDSAQVLRQTLLEKYGIDIRETRDGELLAEYSKDPKYSGRPVPLRPPTQHKDGPTIVPRPVPGATSAPRVRPIPQ